MQVKAFLGLAGCYHKFIRNSAHISKPLMALTHHEAKFAWTSSHLTAFKTLKCALLEAPIFHCLDCGAQLTQEHDGQNFQLHFSHTHLQVSNGNGALWNRKPMAFTLL